MFEVNLSSFPSLSLTILVVVGCGFAYHLDAWRSIERVPPSYFDVSTQNILRCGKLCEKQGLCEAVTYDKRERRCYMHDKRSIDGLKESGSGTNGRYLLKKFVGNSEKSKIDSACNRETRINVPSARNENGACYDIREIVTKPEPITITETTTAETVITETVITETTTSDATTTEATTDDVSTTESFRTAPISRSTTVNREDLCTPDGYTYYPTQNICMKLYRRLRKQATHKARCEGDGAQLLLIRNSSMHEFIKSELTKQSSGSVFVDGENLKSDGIFVSWKGDPLPYIKWKAGDPDNDKCMRLSKTSGFDFGDRSCSARLGCICEKDLTHAQS